ncbi:MAG TPA: Uma2 family endonuclease [Kofleriaceae bacterium]
MVAAQSLFPIEPAAEEQRLVLSGVPWSTYVTLREALDHTNLRMTYLEGTLEILSPSRRHEVEKKQFARFLELFCLERDIPLFAYGSTTWRSEAKARGLEADECYSRGERELPEIAIEVIVSHGSVDKLEVYRGLGIREVWLFSLCQSPPATPSASRPDPVSLGGTRDPFGDLPEGFEAGACTVLSLREAGYMKIPSSEVIPEVDLVRIVQYAMRPDQHAALRAYRDELRGSRRA